MPVSSEPAVSRRALHGRAVFLSASIPDPDRWEGAFDAYEVTDAVVAAARAVLTDGGVLVSAAHPTIAPLLMYVAAELAAPDGPRRVIVYQCDLFESVLPEPTRRFGEEGIGELRWTPAVPGEAPNPGRWNGSLRVMRQQMLTDTDPAGAIFVGGMDGITDEFDLFQELFPGRPVYPVGRPGGEARALAARSDSRVPRLIDDDVYPALFRRIVADLADHLSQ